MPLIDTDLLALLEERGFVHQHTDADGLRAALARGPLTAYLGFDATADSLHVGHLQGLMLMRWLQHAGHRPLLLIGGATTRIGDPSFRDSSRPLLDEATIAANMRGIESAFRRYLLNLEDYGNQAEAQEILDRYFAYAVALDAQQIVLRDAERLEAHMPAWTRPVIVTSTPSASPDGGSSPFAPALSWQPAPAGEGGDSAPGGSPPAGWSLSGQSRRMGTNLSAASLSLSRTLSTAAGDGSSTMDAMNRAVRTSSGRSATRYSGSSSGSRSFSSSRSSSSRSSSSRSSSSRSSGGGGRRGFR